KAGKTDVMIFKKPSAAGIAQPGHIHEGACPGVGSVKYPLTNTTDGKSTTTVDASLASLQAGGFAINLHKSTTEAGVYVACGSIPKKVTITLGPGRDATQAGTVVLLAQGSKTEVSMTLAGPVAGVAQPAHIHEGTCPGAGAVKFPLTNVTDGKSVTVVDMSISDLQKGGFAINAHKSTTEAGVWTACSEIPQEMTLVFGPGRDATQAGSVTFTGKGATTVVTVSLSGSVAGVAQPGHIHEGTCPGVGAVKFPLSNAVDGKSTTEVNATLADLLKGGYSVNFHKSAAEVGVYVACVTIK
ncbi:MAG: hypothetical protein HY327_11460, partial [Chloroflexi bacterium]|nr:hypothetical protein [Chloroflexota bacterium]